MGRENIIELNLRMDTIYNKLNCIILHVLKDDKFSMELFIHNCFSLVIHLLANNI